MRLARAIRGRFVVAVESQTVERTAVQPLADPDAQAGARWGQPATFDLASRDRASDEPSGFSATWIDSSRIFKGTETHREYNHAIASVSGEQLEPEGIRSVTFYLRHPEGEARCRRRDLHQPDRRLREAGLPLRSRGLAGRAASAGNSRRGPGRDLWWLNSARSGRSWICAGALMAADPSDFYHLPRDRVVELGS